jgi:uncharacterized protein YgbK (DUF1537 family)
MQQPTILPPSGGDRRADPSPTAAKRRKAGDEKIRIAVIADDLTGANDTGVQFAKQGLETVVLMGLEPQPDVLDADVVVVDTQSRAMSPRQAYEQAAKAASLFRTGPERTFYKKVDSTLRGNQGAEIDAILDATGLEIAVVAPSFPKNGRTCVGGHVLLQGVPLEATEIAQDPKCPVRQSHLPTLLAGQSSRGIGHVGAQSLLGGPDAVRSAMQDHIAAGRTVLVCDAWLDEHFAILLQAGLGLGKPVLWVGSAGLAGQLPQALAPRSAVGGPAPVLVVAGTASAKTRDQTAVLLQRPGMLHLVVNPLELLAPETRDREIGRCVAEAERARGRDVVVALQWREGLVAETVAKGLSLGLGSLRVSEDVSQGLGLLCRALVERLDFRGLVLTGGDTARSCCAMLGATGIRMLSEVAPGIPLGALRGGDRHGLYVVTKAGAFGDEDALVRAVEALKG